MGTQKRTSAETRIAIRSAMTFNHSETLLAPGGLRNGLNLGNHNETLLTVRTGRPKAPCGLRNGRYLNHSETLVAARTRVTGKDGSRKTHRGIDLANHNESVLAARRHTTGTDGSHGTRNGIKLLNHSESLLAAARS